MPQHLVLYSTNTWLAYMIGERFYDGMHYIWCTPNFGGNSFARRDDPIPPTSSPHDIYNDLYRGIRSGDRHLDKIGNNKSSIRNGAAYKRQSGVIDDAQFRDILAIVDQASMRDFRPLIYVIPFDRVADIVREVPVNERAHPLSVEYIIESLPRECFDIIEFDWS